MLQEIVQQLRPRKNQILSTRAKKKKKEKRKKKKKKHKSTKAQKHKSTKAQKNKSTKAQKNKRKKKKKKKKRKRKKTRKKQRKEASKGTHPRRLDSFFVDEMLHEIVKQLRPKQNQIFGHPRKEKGKEKIHEQKEKTKDQRP